MGNMEGERDMITNAQARHLKNCRKPDPDFRQTAAGYNCRIAKPPLCEWLWLMSDGSSATQSEVQLMPKPLPESRCLKKIIGESLTEAGEKALKEYEDYHNDT